MSHRPLPLSCLLALLLLVPTSAFAQHLETGTAVFTESASDTDATDPSGWVLVSFAQAFAAPPVVIAGPVSHGLGIDQNASWSLSSRVRNVTATDFEVAAMRPEGTVDPFVGIANPSQPITLSADWLAVDFGLHTLDDGTTDGIQVEARTISTITVRAGTTSSGSGDANAGDEVLFVHPWTNTPGVLHSVQSQGDPEWITSSVFGTGGPSVGPDTTRFAIALEGAEVHIAHPSTGAAVAETIGWVAITPGIGSVTDSAGTSLGLDAGLTAGKYIERHEVACLALPDTGVFGFSAVPYVLAKHNSMDGSNGSWVRGCEPTDSSGTFLPSITADSAYVHMEEDQVANSERGGIPEYGAWFAIEPGGTVALTETDHDGDGIPTNDELGNDESDPRIDYDTDGTPDFLDTDSDDDGDPDATDCAVLDASIYAGATELCDGIDSNCDGDLVDGFTDTNGDGDPDCTDDDDDGDGLTDDDETTIHSTDPLNADSDADGLGDGDEVSIYGTDPNDDDSDDDAVLDGAEVLAGTDPLDDDSDDDGLTDGSESTLGTDPLDTDTDNDGLSDGLEAGLTAPQGNDTDSAVFVADADSTTTTDPLLVDTDSGGVTDGAEDANLDGAVDGGETDPNDPTDDLLDLDGDGFSASAGGGGDDCNDSNASVYPGATELCDGLDNDCDAFVDNAPDQDGDGFGPCDGDCDDTNTQVGPFAAEVCNDGLDNDCDGLVDESPDGDGDGFTVCGGDCDDDDDSVYPGAADLPGDGIDSDCDGIDEPATGDDDDSATGDDDTAGDDDDTAGDDDASGDDDDSATGDDDTAGDDDDTAGDDDASGDDDDSSAPVVAPSCGCEASAGDSVSATWLWALAVFPMVRRRRRPGQA
jgi:hypothetical protein